MILRVPTIVLVAMILVVTAFRPDAWAQAKSAKGTEFEIEVVEEEKFVIPVNLWSKGFSSNSFEARDFVTAKRTVRAYLIRGAFGDDRARININIFPKTGNLKNTVDARFSGFIKSFAPKYADAGKKKLRVRGGAGRINKDAVDGCKYFVAAVNSIRSIFFGELCGNAIAQMSDLFKNFATSTPEENRASYAKLQQATASQ